MARKILVIGSNSFSGSNFIDLLLENQNNEVVGISRSPQKSEVFLPYLRHKKPKFRFYQLDLNKDIRDIKNLFSSFKPQHIVNFAAQSEVGPSWSSPWDWFQTNTVALSYLIDYLKDKSYLKKYVHISSPEIYGSCLGNIKEDYRLNPNTPYAVSKAAADLLLFAYFKNHNFPLVMARSTNVYGAHQQLFKIFPRSVIKIKSNKKLGLHGGGQAIKSYIHIRDVSRGELAVLEKGKVGEIYHLSPKEGMVVRDIVLKICQCMGVDFHKVTENVEERLGQDQVYIIDSTKARNEFDWSPQVTLEQGIDEVVSWVNKHWKQIQKLPLEYIHKP